MSGESNGVNNFEKQGLVKFFDQRKGFGFIRPDDNSRDVFLSIDVLKKANQSISQLEDKRCRYVLAEGKKGPYAKEFALL